MSVVLSHRNEELETDAEITVGPTSLNTVSRLFMRMDELVPAPLYPAHVLQVPAEKISGTAFFPGGSGLYLEDRDPATIKFPIGGVMIIGHNFDSEFGFMESARRGKEKLTSGTWGPLLRLLNESDVPVDRCFFTNAYMGLCKGDDSLVYRGRDHRGFRIACRTFLNAQIEIQRPRLIITLGLHVPPLLAELSPDLSFWIGPKIGLKDLDTMPLVPSAGFRFGGETTHRAVVVPIAHPSLPNGARRKPPGFSTGHLGEVEVVQAGWMEAGFAEE